MGDDKFIKAVQETLPKGVQVSWLSSTTEWVLTYHRLGGFPIELRRIDNRASLNWRKPLSVFASIARYELRKRGVRA